MHESKTVLGRICPNDGFPVAVARCMRERAEVARRAIGGPYDGNWTPNHVEALENLAEYVTALNLEDQRIRALWLMQSALGGDSDEFDPGPDHQVSFLHAIGLHASTPPPNEALNELVAAGIEDLTATRHRDSQRVQELAAELAAMDAVKTQLDTANAESDLLRDQLNAARTEASQLREERNYLRTLVPDQPDSPEPAGSVSTVSSGDAGGLGGTGKAAAKPRAKKPKEATVG